MRSAPHRPTDPLFKKSLTHILVPWVENRPTRIINRQGFLTQGSRLGRTVGGSVGEMYETYEMYCSDWSNGIQYQVFDTRPHTEYKGCRVTLWPRGCLVNIMARTGDVTKRIKAPKRIAAHWVMGQTRRANLGTSSGASRIVHEKSQVVRATLPEVAMPHLPGCDVRVRFRLARAPKRTRDYMGGITAMARRQSAQHGARRVSRAGDPVGTRPLLSARPRGQSATLCNTQRCWRHNMAPRPS